MESCLPMKISAAIFIGLHDSKNMLLHTKLIVYLEFFENKEKFVTNNKLSYQQTFVNVLDKGYPSVLDLFICKQKCFQDAFAQSNTK
jgi:hypothetical protein